MAAVAIMATLVGFYDGDSPSLQRHCGDNGGLVDVRIVETKAEWF